MANSNLPVPNSHFEPLYRQTYNSYGDIAAVGLTQDNRVGNAQKVNNARLINANSPKGILAGSVVAVSGSGEIGPAAGDSTTVYDAVVGVAVNDALGNPYESSSALASNKVVYAHGSGTVFKTDIYETKQTGGSTDLVYTAGEKIYASRNGLLTNVLGLTAANQTAITAGSAYATVVGILLQKPTTTDPWMVVQMKI